MLLTEEVIADIRNSASITEVIGHYIPLVKKGRGYTAVCPFHDDHDPSLSISEDKQIFKCFVCGKGGNVFTFVQDFKKITFPQSVAEVAKIIGKPLAFEIENKPVKIDPHQRSYDLLSDYVGYCSYLLLASKKGEAALNYLKNRGLDEDVINYFKIGYNPDDNSLSLYLLSHNYSEKELIDTNVAAYGQNNLYDVFYNRITFPIHDASGHCLAFTARDFTGFSQSKYINSKESELYHKGDHLYNLHRAFEAIKQTGTVFVCEGVMDVIAFYRCGINNVVATLGTACSIKQYELLKKLNARIVLAYDGDKAGLNANLKLGERFLLDGIMCDVINNDTELDPDEILKVNGKNTLRDLAGKRISFMDFVLKYCRNNYNLENYSDRKAVTIKVSKLIDHLNDPYDVENYSSELYNLTRIHRIAGNGKTDPGKNSNRTAVVNTITLDGLTKAEYIILSQMTLNHQAIDMYLKDIGCLIDDDDQYLAMLIIDDERKHGQVSLSRLYDQTDNLGVKKLITDISTADFLTEEFNADLLKGAIERVNNEIRKEKLQDLKKRITRYEKIDPKQTEDLLKEYMEVLKELGGQQNG